MCLNHLVLNRNLCRYIRTCPLVKGNTCRYGPHNYCGRYRETTIKPTVEK
jgi:hypothetical protein